MLCKYRVTIKYRIILPVPFYTNFVPHTNGLFPVYKELSCNQQEFHVALDPSALSRTNGDNVSHNAFSDACGFA